MYLPEIVFRLATTGVLAVNQFGALNSGENPPQQTCSGDPVVLVDPPHDEETSVTVFERRRPGWHPLDWGHQSLHAGSLGFSARWNDGYTTMGSLQDEPHPSDGLVDVQRTYHPPYVQLSAWGLPDIFGNANRWNWHASLTLGEPSVDYGAVCAVEDQQNGITYFFQEKEK